MQKRSGTSKHNIDENYVAHGTCGKCQGDNHWKLEIEPNFDNLRVRHTNKQFRLLLRKGVYPYEYMESWEKFEENHLPQIEAFLQQFKHVGN